MKATPHMCATHNMRSNAHTSNTHTDWRIVFCLFFDVDIIYNNGRAYIGAYRVAESTNFIKF